MKLSTLVRFNVTFWAMERSVYNLSGCQVSLSDILGLQNHPVCEEEAWALCYQLCSLLEQNISADIGESYQTWKPLRLPGPDGILFSSDGRVSLTIDTTKVDDQFIMETEEQAVDYVGRLMYSCLDWGLGADVERELNKTLELLVCQMTKVNTRLDEHCLLPMCSLSEVLQVCEERLYNPRQAAQHYRNVCSTLYSHTIELCRYMQIIQQTREGLQKMIMESETSLLPNITTNWELTWKHLVEELSRGVILQPPKEKLNTNGVPVPVDASPFSQLLQDIQLRRYKLRKVQVVGNHSWKTDTHQVLLSLIRAGPKLRPVSERKMVSRAEHPKQEVSLHELLMEEIRSTDRVKLLSSYKRRQSCKVDNGCSSFNSLMPIHEYSSNEDTSFFLNPVLNPDQQGMTSQARTCKGTSSPQEHSFTAEGNLKFFPALASTPLSPVSGLRLSQGKRRARSFASHQELLHHAMKTKVTVPMTIAEVVNVHYSKEGKTCDLYRNWRVCSCCTKRSLFFTWHNLCSLCNGVVCPECCVEMHLPFKWCVNLPINFFKKIVLNKESEQSQRNFWNERWSWDPSRIPLVLASRLPNSLPLHSLAMRDWHSQDICIDCQSLLLEACDSVQNHCPITNPQEI